MTITNPAWRHTDTVEQSTNAGLATRPPYVTLIPDSSGVHLGIDFGTLPDQSTNGTDRADGFGSEM